MCHRLEYSVTTFWRIPRDDLNVLLGLLDLAYWANRQAVRLEGPVCIRCIGPS